MSRKILSIAFRFGLPLLGFVLIFLVSEGVKRLFSFSFDLTILIIILLIATAWYLGRAPGIFIAIIFEATLVYFTLSNPQAAAQPASRLVFYTINRLVLFLSIVIFASARRNAEQRLREQHELLQVTLKSEQAARREAELAGQLKDEFLATVSHELRTPLSAILGWTTMLKNKRIKGVDGSKALEVIERNAKSQGEIINDLLDVSQLTTGKLQLEKERVEIGALILESAEAIRPQAEAKSVDFTVSVDEGGLFVLGDVPRLRQIVSNLVSNAVKFTPAGGSVKVNAGARGDEEEVEITISDSGIGIDAQFLPFVFETFRQGDASVTRPHGGLGLGLSIVKHLVNLHDSKISVASEGENRGAVFIVRLPLAENRRNINSAGNSAS